MVTRSRACAVLFGGTALGMAGLTVRAQSPVQIRIAGIPAEAAALPYYAREQGFFGKAGLDADIQQMQSGPAIAAAIAAGAIDFGYSTVDVIASIRSKNIPLVIVAPASEYSSSKPRGTALLIGANSSVREAKDLNGKIFGATALHSIAETAPRAWMDQNGGDSSTVKFIEVPLPAMTAALQTGRIDAAWVTEPFLSVAKNTTRVLAYGYDAIAKHFLTSAWFASVPWTADHPGVTKAFVAAMHDTAVWANKNPARTADIVATTFKLDPAVIAAMTRATYGEQLTPALLQPLIDVSAKYNGFKTFPAQELMYVSR